MKHCRIIQVLALCSGIVVKNANAIDIAATGLNPVGSITPTSVFSRGSGASIVPAVPNHGWTLIVSTRILSASYSTDCATMAAPNNPTRDGLAYGWELQPNSGIYGIIYDSQITALSHARAPADTVYQYIPMTATWGANGEASKNAYTYTANCYTGAPAGYWFSFSTSLPNSLSGDMKYGVYVDTTRAVEGNYTLQFSVGKDQGTYTAVTESIKVALTACTVSTPNSIPFGNVDAGSTAPVVSPAGGIDISCTGQRSTVNVSYSTRAVSATQTATTLAMINQQGETQGSVRGFIGTNADNEAGCNNAVTSIHFDTAPRSLLTAVANNQAYTIPLKWVLCPVSSAAPGQGTASATLDIIWQ